MATIQLKRSSVNGKIPTTTDLALGEIAINTYNGRLFIKQNNGSDSIVELMRADFNNGLGLGMLCGDSTGAPRFRTLSSGNSAISVTDGNGSAGNPTVTFQPGSVAITSLNGILTLGKGGTGATTQAGAANAVLPTQTSNNGKFLTTDGSNVSWATVSASPAGSTGQVQYNNSGSFAGATNITVSATGNMILKSAASDTPTGTDLVVFNEVNFPSGLSTCNSYGVETALQRAISTCEIGWWNPPGNATTVPGVLGIAAPTVQGTATSRAVALTNIATRAKRLGYVSSSAATGSMCGHYWGVAQFAMGNGAGLGGFYMNWRFCISDAVMVPQAVMMIGVTSLTSAPTAVNPVTHINCIAVGHAYNDTTLRIYYGGSAAQPLIDLGANFPVTKTDLYEFSLYVPNNTDNVAFYRVKRLGTAYEATGTLTGTAGVVLPASSTPLAPRAWRTNNSVQTAVALDIAHFYTETQQY